MNGAVEYVAKIDRWKLRRLNERDECVPLILASRENRMYLVWLGVNKKCVKLW